MTRLLLLTCFTFLSCQSLRAYPQNQVKIEFPKIKSQKLLVIAPAKKYSMEKPLFEKITKLALESGYIVARFNWLFYTENRVPSAELLDEALEFETILRNIQNKLHISKYHTTVLAKSFGSQVIAKSNYKAYQNLALVTPNCDEKKTFSKTYKNLLVSIPNIQISISKDDPYCNIKQIYNAAQYFNKNTTILTTYGDHNFETSKNPRNQNEIVRQIINWMNNL